MRGNDLRKLRRGVLDMTQQQLADALHLSERTISEYENRDEDVPKTVELAARALAYPVRA